MISLAFDNEVVLTDDGASLLRRLMSPLSQKQTDEILVYFWVDRPLRPAGTFPNLGEEYEERKINKVDNAKGCKHIVE